MTLSIATLLSPDQVLLDIDASGKLDAINSVISVLSDNADVVDMDRLTKDIVEREYVMSTGVGYGLALPHAKSQGVSATVAALGITNKPIEFNSIDGEPVRLIFLLAGPASESSKHIRILSRVSRLMSRETFRRKLLECEGVPDVLRVFESAENLLLKTQ